MFNLTPDEAWFSFTCDEIDRAKTDLATWSEFIRIREAQIIFSHFDNHMFARGLELGAGNTVQSKVIAAHCARLVCTELDEKRFKKRAIPNVEYKLCDAEDMSCFADSSFDMIFSSNMIEHLHNPENCLRECRRVMADDAVAIFTMPNRTWKTFYTLLSFYSIKKLREVHGVQHGHIAEWIHFNPARWQSMFETNGLKVLKKINLPFYVGHGNRFIPITKFGNMLGMSAVVCFILGKK